MRSLMITLSKKTLTPCTAAMSFMKRTTAIFILLLLCAFIPGHTPPAQAAGQSEVYFSPAGGARQAIIEKLDAARNSVDVAMYILTNHELGDALIAANHRGVKVRVLLDGSQDEQYYSQGRYLSENDVQVRIDRTHMLSGDDEGIMHNKFAVVDSVTVITGSYNWTVSAEDRNDENLLIITGATELTAQYMAQFEALWTRGVPYDIRKLLAPLIIEAHDDEALREHSGQEAYVQGRVHNVRFLEDSGAFFLDFGPDRSSFTAVIYKKAARKFAELKIKPAKFEGKRIEVYGRIVNNRRYGPEIIVDDPAQIRIMDKK